MSFAAMILIACLIDICVGWPDRLFQRIGHPVTWIGALIAWLENHLNTGTDFQRFKNGCFVTLVVVGVTASVTLMLQLLLPDGWLGLLIGAVIAWPFLAIRSMYTHVAAVARPLTQGDLTEARNAVSMIVGRDPNQLDTAGVARSALESLAENTSDGIMAPVFWGVIAGLPGIAAYKAINTLDSMIGHRNPRYEKFGKSAARLDDLVNLIPARITGALFALVSGHTRRAIRVMLQDARTHRSPNAGWPEGAMAGGLNIRLSGPRVYEDRVAKEPWLNADAPDPSPGHLTKGLAIYTRAVAAMLVLLLGAAWIGI